MRNCEKCGSELNETSRFCGRCGAKITDGGDGSALIAVKLEPDKVQYCEKCGAKLPEGCANCLICGTKAGEAPPPEPESVLPAEVSTAPATAVRSHSKRLVTFCVAICVLLALSASGLWLANILPYLTSGALAPARGAIIYLTADNSLKFKTYSMEAPQEIISDYHAETHISGDGLARASQSGRYIAYLNEYATVGEVSSGQLYLRDFGQKRSLDAAPVPDMLIAENVTSGFFFVENSSALAYLTSGNLLCVTDFTDTRAIDEGVAEIIDHSDSQILYSKTTDNGEELYLASVSGNINKIDGNIIYLIDYTPTFDKFVYLRAGQDLSRDIIAYDLKQNKQQPLAVGIDEVVAADAATATALYQTAAINPLRYEDIIDDRLVREDEAIDEPDMSDYPLLLEFNEKFGTDEEYKETMNYEEIVAESARFQSDVDDYDGKRERDRIRDEVHETISVFVDEFPKLYDLHITSGGAITKLASGSLLPYTDAELNAAKGFVVWTSTSLKNLEKLQITHYPKDFSAADLLNYLHSGASESLYLQQSGYASIPIHIGNGQFYSSGWQLTDKGDGIYFAMGEGNPADYPANGSTLYYAPLSNGSTGSIIQVDENIAGVGPMLSGNRLLYYKDRFEDICDLYLMSGVSGEKIGDNISLLNEFFKVKNDKKTLLYCEHFNADTEAGNMFLLAKQNRQLATEVHRVFYRSDSLVYFLRSVRSGKAELYSFSGEGLSLLDENVIAVME